MAFVAIGLTACTPIAYYSQLAKGQYQLLSKREPMAKLIADPATDDKLRAKLKVALEARAFASDVLDLPHNGSYTDYADLGRPYVLQNVFAAPEFSLDAVEHCFPIAGCVAYRGYYDAALANAEVERLKAQGYEVYLGSVPAYSTLGWFDDPVLNTMLPREGAKDDDELASTIFHELAHQKIYVKGDTRFNESYATFVEQEGLRLWRAAHGQPQADSQRSRRADQFTEIILATRERLKLLYASGLPADEMRARKREEIEHLRSVYRVVRDEEWQGYKGYDGWIEADINNAKLLPFGLYHQWLPGFALLFAKTGGDWPAFFEQVRKLADESPAERARVLEADQGCKP